MYRIDYLLCNSDIAISQRTGARRGRAKGIKYGRTSSSGGGQGRGRGMGRGRGRGRRQSRVAGRGQGRDSRQGPGSSILNEPGKCTQ